MLIGASIVVGAVGWSGYVLALPIAMLFPALWAHSRSRTVAAFVSAGYFLAASRGLPEGVANFYDSDLWPGLLLWCAASLCFVLVQTALWSHRLGWESALRYGAAAVLMAVPPFGIAGWAHPLTAAGVVFPGWGWLGLGAAAAGLAVMTTRWWPAAAITLSGFWLWSAAMWTDGIVPEGWRGVDLELGESLGRDSSLDRHRDMIATVREATAGGARFVLLPESALGLWTPTVSHLWQDGLRGRNVVVIAGAAVVDPDGYDNVLVSVWAGDARVLYRERMPVPGSMWQPWRGWIGQGGGARAHFFANTIVDLAGSRIAPLICYEQLLIWPVLHSMIYSPDMIVATGNGWWTSGTSIVAIQKASAAAWARLFDLPLVTAFNT
ncbi:conjugal transfer protein TraB [Ensifer sp. ENS02]|uniref:conjugal transfer protein TraB n=1 Tax=Ensifer sp. ENS02 TaxID=2769290 RepID=UPI001FF012DC|nr:conjugal transfer protein TraB [Ensifer sp. ENS02]